MNTASVAFVGYLSDVADYKPGYLYIRSHGIYLRLHRENGQLSVVTFESMAEVLNDAQSFVKTVSSLFFTQVLHQSPFTEQSIEAIARVAMGCTERTHGSH